MSAVPRRLFALVDCSAFYVSCEQVFDPSLAGVPVAVLSNNDGCVIARSQEVKDAGVKMGEPFFKARERLAASGARVFSSNYTLYGDMSRRVMDTLLSVTPDVVPYSIDEAFLELPTGATDTHRPDPEAVRERMGALASEVRRRVLKWTGIPVRVSVAETKTLAKAASEYARAQLRSGGEPTVCLWGHPDRDAWLEAMPVEDVWGVGRRWGQRLRDLEGSTAAKLSRLDDALIRKRFNVVLLRTAYELRGVPCVSLDDAPVRKTLVRSRSFGEPVSDLATIRASVATHAARAAEKLRREGLVATHAARAAEKLRREGLVAGRLGAMLTTKQLCWKSSDRRHVLAPPLSVPRHRVEGHKELPHDGDEGHLLRLPSTYQPVVERPQFGVRPRRRQRAQVERRTHRGPAARTSASTCPATPRYGRSGMGGQGRRAVLSGSQPCGFGLATWGGPGNCSGCGQRADRRPCFVAVSGPRAWRATGPSPSYKGSSVLALSDLKRIVRSEPPPALDALRG